LTILSYQPLGQPDPQAFNLGVAMLIMVVIVLSSFFCKYLRAAIMHRIRRSSLIHMLFVPSLPVAAWPRRFG